MPSERPQTFVEIDLAALARNFRRFAEKFCSASGIIFSGKKGAYGHGLVECARALEREPQLWGAGVATAEEGLGLRSSGFAKPVLCFSVLRGEELEEAIRAGVLLTVTAAGDADEADAAARKLGAVAEAHLKIDTGMGRLGLTAEETLAAAPRIRALKNLRLAAIYTHFPNAWADPAGAREQTQRLAEFSRAANMGNLPAHIGGSDALGLLRTGEAAKIPDHASMIRSGIAIYGAHPGIADLEPVMTLKSRVLYRRRARAGSKISYGGTAVLKRDSELALVGAGYGNGYPVSLSNKGSVLLGAARCPVLGRVCMDQIIADVTDAPQVQVGDEAVLFGKEGNAVLPVAEIAERAGTISYELLCMAGQINPRVYIGAS